MQTRRTIDAIDETILSLIQSNARATNVELARAVGLAPSAVLARVRRLRRAGILRGAGLTLDRSALGFGTLAFINVRTDEPPGSTAVAAALAALPEVLEVHDVAGPDCYVLKVVARDVHDLHRVLRESIGSLRYVRATATTIVMKSFKESTAIPIRPHGSATHAARARPRKGKR